jgi:hypothetical protein
MAMTKASKVSTAENKLKDILSLLETFDASRATREDCLRELDRVKRIILRGSAWNQEREKP